MRRRSVPLRAASVAVFAGLVGAVACEDATEVTLVLTTDLPCGTMNGLNGTTITVGTADEIEDKAPVALAVTPPSDQCVASGSGLNTIGTFVLVPSHGRSDPFSVRIVSGVGNRQASDCAPGGGQTPDYTGCIVARRALAFVPHTPLTLPIVMRRECESKPCKASETCDEGECVPSVISDPSRCVGAGCSETTLLEGGGIEAGPPDAELPSDAAESDALQADAPGLDAPSDGQGMADAPMSDGAAPDGRILDGALDAAMKDATVADAPGPDGAPLDATSQDASSPGDASVLGGCVDAGSSAGVTCGTATCGSGEVCCVAQPTTGSTTYSCTSSAACDTSATGGTEYSSLACRDVGDCASGSVCCLLAPAAVGAGYTATCKPTCTDTFFMVQACRNTCECGGTTCGVATTCPALAIGTCGGTCP